MPLTSPERGWSPLGPQWLHLWNERLTTLTGLQGASQLWSPEIHDSTEGRRSPTLGWPTASPTPDMAQVQLPSSLCTWGQRGQVTQNPAITPWEVCVCERERETNTVIPLTLHHSWVSALPPPHRPVPGPHSPVSGREADACLDGVIWRKSPHTPQNISLADLPEILITGTRFLCIQASCFQKFPVKGKCAQKHSVYSAFEFLFPSATLSSLTFTSSRRHSPDPPKHLTNTKTSPTRTEAWNPNLGRKS